MTNNNEKYKELISAYIDGCVSDAERKQAEDLILNSKEWQDYYKELKQVSSLLQDWPDEQVSGDLTDKIQRSLLDDKLREEPIMEGKKSMRIGGGAFVAIALCVFIGAIYLKTFSNQSQFKYAQRVDDYDRTYLEQQQRTEMAKLKANEASYQKERLAQKAKQAPEVVSSTLRESVGGKLQDKKAAAVAAVETSRVDTGFDLADAYRDESSIDSPVVQNQVAAPTGPVDQLAKYSNAPARKDNQRTRGTGGFQESSYDTSLGLIQGLGDPAPAPRKTETYKRDKNVASVNRLKGGGFQVAGYEPRVTQESTSQVGQLARIQEPAFPAQSRPAPAEADFVGGRAERQASVSSRRAAPTYEPYYLENEYEAEEAIVDREGYWQDDRDGEYRYRPRNVRRSNTEEYDPVYENPFMSAKNNPLSTFSVDVDTASYSNIRRFLKQGQMPPAASVRIEEMLNYFSYDYDQPKRGEPFSVNTDAAVSPWNPGHYLVRIGLQGAVPSERKIPPSNLVFLIDVSGSMNNRNKLPLLKRCLKMMVDQLRDDQRVAIVTYSGSARLVLDSTPGAYKARIHAAIDSLRAGGSTAGEAGLKLAYRIARDNYIKNGNNRVIMASDGDFNVGMQNDYELVRLISDKRKEGVFLSILGFGTGNLKDAKMEKIADNGNGTYHYIDSLREGEKVLVQELGSTLFTIAKDVKVQIEFNPDHIQAYRLIGYENRMLAKQDFNDDRVDAGEIGAGHTVTAIYEVVPVGMRPMPYQQYKSGVDPLKYQRRPSIWNNPELMTVKLRYKKPNGNRSRLIKRVVQQNHILSRPSGDLQFAAAVAEFGLMLRNSRYKGHASYDHVLRAVRSSLGSDKDGQRSELIGLVETARQLDYQYRTYPVPYDDYPQPQPYPYAEPYHQQPPMQFK